MCYKIEEDDTYFLLDGEWIHEMFLDVILGMREEICYEAD
jgi:hypothetical protein